MRSRYAVLALVVLLAAWHFADGWPSPTPGDLAPDPPLQTAVAPGEVPPWTDNGCKITALARYSLKARILHRERYWLDREATVSPIDFALGWGAMSDPAVYNKLNISQGMRWYTWEWSGTPPIPADQIPLLSANTHLIPANSDIRDRLLDLRAGDIVQLTGYLVQVNGPNGWRWDSSLTRTDTGSGSCELMWVTAAAKVGR